MLSSSFTPKPLSLSHHHHQPKHLFAAPHHHSPAKLKPISASDNQPSRLILPNSPSSSNSPPPQLIIPNNYRQTVQPQTLYQPFRPPPNPLPPKFRSLDTASRIDVLANRLGSWFEYAPLITALFHEGFTPPTVEELTGITGVEQNRLVVAAQVRASLADPDSPASHQLDDDLLSYFDTSGAEILYQIRLLSASQRAAAAKYIVFSRIDGKGARILAKAIKEFPLRRGEPGWESFDYELPADCLSYMYFRLSKEYEAGSPESKSALNSALEVVESDRARARVLEELEGKKDGDANLKEDEPIKVPVVRLMVGEVAEASTVVVLPACKAADKDSGILSAPFDCRTDGEFGVIESDKAWKRWVVLPGWEPAVALGRSGGGLVVEFPDSTVLPWRANTWYKEETILVVADRKNKVVEEDDGFYLVVVASGDMKVKRGSDLKKMGVAQSLGAVVMVVRPPKDVFDDQLSEEDWD